MHTKRSEIIYWISTGLLAFGMTAQGIAQILQTRGYVDVFAQLGYPVYFLSIIGAWKLLGVIAILTPRLSLIKEWAYAGFFLVMSGAAFSHLAAGAPAGDMVPALILLTLIVVSWYFRPADRKFAPVKILNA